MKQYSVGLHCGINDKIAEFKMLSSELVVTKREDKVEEICDVL